ncbi:MAG: hypothetical protein ACXVB9_07625 [Bdellovibrionota bacterium]
MKLISSLAILFAVSSASAFAQDYNCHAPANPNRGFAKAMDVTLSPDAMGGSFRANGKELGKISQISTLDRSKADQKEAFDFLLGYLNEQDVSGLDPAALKRVTSIVAYQFTPDTDTTLYRFYEGSKQTGGSFASQGLGTACLAQ